MLPNRGFANKLGPNSGNFQPTGYTPNSHPGGVGLGQLGVAGGFNGNAKVGLGNYGAGNPGTAQPQLGQPHSQQASPSKNDALSASTAGEVGHSNVGANNANSNANGNYSGSGGGSSASNSRGNGNGGSSNSNNNNNSSGSTAAGGAV